MYIEEKLISAIHAFLNDTLNVNISKKEILLLPTKKDYDGDYTFTSFAFAKLLKIKPQELSKNIGEHLKNSCNIVCDYNVVGGFLNIVLKASIWINQLLNFDFNTIPSSNNLIAVVEFPSPNTNKPLHLGHLRNMFLGVSISNILEYVGFKVKRVNLVNDRGIHICKSMVAYQKFGKDETPSSTNLKGDHFVGKYYVKFEQELKKEIKESGDENKSLEETNLMKEAKEMLIKWEKGDKQVKELWKKMNNWVYQGFDETFEKLDIKIDKTYYESETYLLGKEVIKEGLEKKCFYKKGDNSVWIDLQNEGLDNKLLLRSDGTSVYMTQDIGTADKRYKDFKFNKSIYIVGNEQDYHFNVLFKIMKKLGRKFADNMYHLSYGMVDLPSGKMKSREGTVVDADNLVNEMIETAKEHTSKLGKIENFSSEEAYKLYKVIAIGALKYFLLKVDPKKRMLFDPKASIDFHGDTGPFIQYTYARISTLLEKAKEKSITYNSNEIDKNIKLENIEKNIITHMNNFYKNLNEAAKNYSPAQISQYVYNLTKLFNKLYADFKILKEDNSSIRSFRLYLASKVAELIKINLDILGIISPNKM